VHTVAKATALRRKSVHSLDMDEHPKKTIRRRSVTTIRILQKVKDAAGKAAEADGQSLSGYIEALLLERLKKKGHLE
jgi:hypothetical protein